MENKSNTQFHYEQSDRINEVISKPFEVRNLATTANQQILCVCMQKEAIFPEHTSPREASLIVLEGNITFYIDGRQFQLAKQHHFRFPAAVTHWVKAHENSKFLIIR